MEILNHMFASTCESWTIKRQNAKMKYTRAFFFGGPETNLPIINNDNLSPFPLSLAPLLPFLPSVTLRDLCRPLPAGGSFLFDPHGGSVCDPARPCPQIHSPIGIPLDESLPPPFGGAFDRLCLAIIRTP